jgi:predicted Zn-dependent peptidase
MTAQSRRTVPDRVPVPRALIAYRIAPFGTHEFDVLQVLGVVLGGGRGSRLYKSMVLDRQLVQPDDSMVDSWPFIGGAALLLADLPAREGVDIAVAEAAYHEEVARLADGVSEAEMERARALLTGHWLHHLAKVDGRADTFSQYTTLLGDPGLVEQALPNLLAVTADEVVATAADVMTESNSAVVTFVPESGDAEVAA